MVPCPRSFRVSLHCAVVCLLTLAADTAQAQLPPCEYPPIFSGFPTWNRNAQVRVIIDTDFSQPMRDAIRQGFRNWNYASGMYDNCSGVFFHEPTYEDIPDHYMGNHVPYLTVMVKQRPEEGAYSDARTTAGSVVRALITIGACVHLADSMTGIAAHEVGHTFGLDNCLSCTALSSLMARAYGGPPPYDNCNANNHGLQGPTACDNALISGFYCAVSHCPPQDMECPMGYFWDGALCRCEPQSPIVVDVEGDGFDLTDNAGGVLFDLNADGVKERLSWTAAGSDDAWLALDRDGDGTVDDGRELFGNYSPQPEPPTGTEKNGFLALAEFDKAATGGNSDGVIDKQDGSFNRLLLWQDTNHNGVSEDGELHTWRALGLKSVDLDYRESRRRDERGNWFRYRAKVKDKRGHQLGRWAWDVFLVPAP